MPGLDKEIGIAHLGNGVGWFHRDVQRLADAFELRRPIDRLGQLRARRGKRRRRARIEVSLAVWQRQQKRSLFGNTQLVVADDPAGLPPQIHGSARLSRGNRDFAQDQDGLVEPVCDKFPEGNDAGHRKLEFGCRESRREIPAHGRRQAGVARIDPVGVPHRVRREPEPDGDRSAVGRYRRLLRDQFRRGIAGPHRVAPCGNAEGETADNDERQRPPGERPEPPLTDRSAKGTF